MRFINSIAVVKMVGVAIDKVKADIQYNNVVDKIDTAAKKQKAADIANTADLPKAS